MNTIVDVETLAALLQAGDVVVADCRFSLADPDAGRRAYAEGHVPGAVYLDLNRQMSDPHIPGMTGRHPLPRKQAWIERVLALGLEPGMQVVAYDDAGGAMAARLWWMLRWIGHDKVAVLDGGWQAWTAAGQPTSADIPSPRPGKVDHYSGLSPLTRVVEAGDIDGERQVLLDARDKPRFLGEIEPIDPVAGHIPGAVCSPFSGNLGTDGKFLDAGRLRDKFAAAVSTDKDVVCYCGSGVTAAHNILAMNLAGLDEPALYPGSWSEWITDPQRPVVIGE